MRPALLAPCAVLALAVTAGAQTPLAPALPVQKGGGPVAAAGGGAFLGGGNDSCVVPDPIAGSGTFPFATGTTGTEGQNEPGCLAFGQLGIQNDVWFAWTADADGLASLGTCAGTTVDTKIAVYPGAGCPVDGTSLACNDDTCGLQSRVTWAATAGTTYTVQLGTFPGAQGGSGTFAVEIESGPPGCPQHSDDSSENSLGLVAGGDMIVLQYIDCLDEVACIEVAFGTPLFPDPSLNGLDVVVAVYSDADDDPTNGMSLLATSTGVISMEATDTFIPFPIDPPAPIGGSGWIAAVAICHLSGQYPFGFDSRHPNPDSWVAGDNACALDLEDLNAGDVPPLNMQALGYPSSWLLRASDEGCAVETVGEPYCFGVGCPCVNDDPNAGCANSTGDGGSLFGLGTASVASDDLALVVDDLPPNAIGIVYAGGAQTEVPFGDGLRCIHPGPSEGSPGTGFLRFPVRFAGVDGGFVEGPGIVGYSEAHFPMPFTAGSTWRFQGYYRDGAGPCGSTFNFTNALTVLFH